MKYDLEPRGWIVAEETFDPRRTAKCESIFAQGNGYINIRCALEEGYLDTYRGAFITGTFNKAMPDEVTELPNLPDVTAMEFIVTTPPAPSSASSDCAACRTVWESRALIPGIVNYHIVQLARIFRVAVHHLAAVKVG